MRLGMYTAICEEDKEWIPQYLKEVERLDVPFVIHFDKCFFPELAEHKNCVGFTKKEEGEFSERDKQGVFDLLKSKGFEWGCAWDIDETWDKNFTEKLALVENSGAEYIDCPWVNLWESDDMVRRDGAFGGGHRAKFYKLNREWIFTHPITNGAKHRGGEEPIQAKVPIVCIHHGLKTKALRKLHKDRWDRIYTHHVGNNPYGFWAFALDESVEVTLQDLEEYYDKHRV